MSTGDEDTTLPKSMRHKQVLDAAAEHPDAAIDDIASMVPSATAELVERVLEEHGDPADDDQSGSDATPAGEEDTTGGSDDDFDEASTTETPETAGDEESNADESPQFDPETLTEKQRAVLELVATDPSATQRAIGEQLGISAATVSNRVNAIPGFDWNDRATFVDRLPEDTLSIADTAAAGDGDDTDAEDSAADVSADDPEESENAESAAQQDGSGEDDSEAKFQAAVEELRERMDALEAEVDTIEQSLDTAATAHSGERTSSDSPFDNPELVRKVAHACLSDEAITEDEERRILQGLLAG